MRFTFVASAVAAATFTAAACGPPPPPPPVVIDPAKCGQTQDGKAMVTLAVNAGLCTRNPNQKLVIVYQDCGPLMAGSNTVDDCWRGNVPGIPSPDNFRLGFIQANNGQAINFVASDATAA